MLFEEIQIGRRLCGAALLLTGFFLARPAGGQIVGTCADARAEAYLDVNNVRARIFNNGPLFWRSDPFVYEVPKGSGVNALFTNSLLIGGLVQGDLRVAAARYNNWEFWPGPLDDAGNPPSDCAPFDHLWEITRDDLIAYAKTGEPTQNLADWPWHLGAPVLDGDGNLDNYDLAAGDRPALVGDQMLWWVMNDAGNRHESTGPDSPPIGMEVHGTAFAFQRPNSYIDNVTFYRYVLHYKGRDPFEDAYFGLFSDPDLGNFDDDYLGSDSTLHLAYVYNADNLDEGFDGYGPASPAVGYTFLRSALADADGRDNDRDGVTDEPGEMLGLSSFVFFNVVGRGNGGDDPYMASHYYRYMQGRWKDGHPVTLGGNGRDFSTIPTPFFYSGDPVTGAFWSERNTDGQDTPNPPYDRQFVQATGPFTMQPGGTQEILFAIVWARGTDHLDSVRRLKINTRRLRDVAEAILQPDVTSGLPEPEPALPPVLGFAQNYPNPFAGTTLIRYSLPQAMRVRLRVYDVLGREIAALVDEHQAGGVYAVPFAADALPAGVYLYRIEMDHLTFTRPMTLTR